MTPTDLETPAQTVATVVALFLGQKGWTFFKQTFLAETNERLDKIEKQLNLKNDDKSN